MVAQLSQDLPEEEKESVNLADILGDIEEDPKEVEEETTEEKTPTEEVEKTKPVEEVIPEKVEKETTEEERLPTLKEILGDTEEIKEELSSAVDGTDKIKETVEDAQEAIKDEDTNEAAKLIDDLYKQVIEYSTKVDTLSTKNDVLQSKLTELSTSNADYELQIAQTAGKSSDPKMIILNRMYDNAITGEQFSKDKVISTLEDMYYTLKGGSFDETRISNISDDNAGEVILNNKTAPAIEEVPEETIDLNDISSIF